MIVSRKAGYTIWKNLEGYYSRLSGSYWGGIYRVNCDYHRIYGESSWEDWDLNHKSFWVFKEI